VLPQASVVDRRSGDQELEVLTSRQVFTAEDSVCTVQLDIADAGLPADEVTGPTVTLTIDAAGDPETAELNMVADDGEPLGTADGACYPHPAGGIQCLKGGVAFTLHADIPFQHIDDDGWINRYRVDGRTTTFSASVGGADSITETERHRTFVAEHIEARLAAPVLAKL